MYNVYLYKNIVIIEVDIPISLINLIINISDKLIYLSMGFSSLMS
jgi:hypothetical protein